MRRTRLFVGGIASIFLLVAGDVVAQNPAGFGVLTVSDSGGGSRELLYGGQLGPTDNPESYSLPPAPPQGAFDARFNNDSRLLQLEEETIRVQSVNYPLQITVTSAPDAMADDWFIDELPIGPTHHLSTEGSFTVANTAVTRFRLRRTASVGRDADVEGVEFEVHGNYPNPFSESTTLVLDLPEAAEVEVQLFDLLGREVGRATRSTLAGGAGRLFRIDTRSLSSGVYMYSAKAQTRLQKFVATGRLTVLEN